jgi:hypothetical protein
VLVLDPLIELIGGIDENSNGDMSAALAELRSLAVNHRMAILLVHHTRKGTVVPGDMDAARGASSLHGKVRQGLTVVGMTEEEATAMGISQDARRHYVRLDDGKASYAPLGAAQWFERLGIELQNGDSAPTLLPWQMPIDTITPEIRAKVEAGIARGSPEGPWSPTFSNKPRSVRNLMVECGVTTSEGQKKLLGELLDDGFEKAKFISSNHRKELGLRSPGGKPSTVKWVDDDASE